MIKHIGMFTLKEEHGGRSREENASQILANVDGLRAGIPGISHIEAGRPFVDARVAFPQADMAVYVEFETLEDYEAYFNHPKHREAAAFAASVSAAVAGITYVVEGS